jgi:ribosome-binding protein aMBF1 (putative translation factor)
MKYQKHDLTNLLDENNRQSGVYLDGKELEFELACSIFIARLLNDLSQEELAQKVGTTQSVISRLESGKHTPSLALVKRVAEALGLSAKVIFH